MRTFLLSAALLLSAAAAQAAEITLMAPGLLGPGFVTLAAQWKAQTGNTAVLAGGVGTVGKIEQVIASGGSADIVVLPPGEFPGMADKLKPGSEKKIGQVLFGLAVKTGAPHPDISTAAKFRAALKGKSVAYNDPAIGSIAGKMVDALLKQPEYAEVNGAPAKGTGGQAVADGKADMTIAVETEEVQVKGYRHCRPSAKRYRPAPGFVGRGSGECGPSGRSGGISRLHHPAGSGGDPEADWHRRALESQVLLLGFVRIAYQAQLVGNGIGHVGD